MATNYATLLRDHVTLECRSMDRIFMQAYVPTLQSVGQVCRFLRWQRGFEIPSSAAFGKIGEAYVAEVHRFAKANGIPVKHFAKGECKEAFARPLLEAAAREQGDGRVVLIGIAQEKASAWRSWKAKGQENARHPHMEWGREWVFINHFYFYVWDPDWGGAFLKTNAYAPYPIWLWLNGHEWAKRELEKARIPYEALDNGFRSCADPAALQRICRSLGPADLTRFFWRWLRRLPSPFTPADLAAGYVYDLAFRQIEISDTRVFDRPQTGRAFFEGLIRDHLDIGRPSSIALIFDRKVTVRTPGSFRTKVVTHGVDPQICCYYRSSRVKQYFKLHRALRTETVISDTRDFGVGRRLTTDNWRALRAIGDNVNRRLCDAQAQDAQPAPDAATFGEVTRPSTTPDGLHASALRFGDARVMAVLAALLSFCHVFVGFSSHDLARLVGPLLGAPYSPRQATYDLRRLRRKRLIQRMGRARRYQLTPRGRRVAALFTKVYQRTLLPGLAVTGPQGLPTRHPLATAWRHFSKSVDDYVHCKMLGAA